MRRLLCSAIAATAVAAAGPAWAAIMVPFSASVETKELGTVTLDFSVAGGVVSLDASTSSDGSVSPDHADANTVVAAWDGVVGTADSRFNGHTFTLTINATSYTGDGGASPPEGPIRQQNKAVEGGGLGTQGRNQYRIDDTGTEFLTFDYAGVGELLISGFGYVDDAQGAADNPVGNLRLVDSDTAVTYLLGTDPGSIDVRSDGFRIDGGESLVFTTHSSADGDLNGVDASAFIFNGDAKAAGAAVSFLSFELVPEPMSALVALPMALVSLVRRRV